MEVDTTPATDAHYSANLHRYSSGNRLYDWHMRVFRERIAEMLLATGATSVLDVGCGEGIVTHFIAEQAPRLKVSGVDASPDAIAYAQEHFGDTISFRTGDIYRLPFSNSAFDAVLCSEVLEHLDDPDGAMRQLKRVARKHILITVPLEPYFKFFNDLGQRMGYSYDPGHVQFWNYRAFQHFIGKHLKNPQFSRKHYYQLALGEV